MCSSDLPPEGAVAPKASPFAGYADAASGTGAAPAKPKGKKKPGPRKPGGFKGKAGGPSKAAKTKFGKSNFAKANTGNKAAKGKPKGKPQKKG